MILVTHEMAFAREVADRVIMMADGQVVEDAPPARLLLRARGIPAARLSWRAIMRTA